MFSVVNLQREVKGGGLNPWNIPKIQGGFVGPGMSQIAESLLRFRKTTYIHKDSYTSRECSKLIRMASSSFELLLWSEVRKAEVIVDYLGGPYS